MNEAATADTPSVARQRIAILAAALPALALSARFAWVLVAPLEGGNAQWAVDAVTLLVLEFFLVHAGFMSMAAMTGPRTWRIGLALLLGAIYLGIIGVFALVLDGPGMALIAAVLLAGRLSSAALGGPGEMKERIAGSVVSVVFYMAAVIGTVAIPGFPAFGFTPEAMQALRPLFGFSSGVWIEEPYRAVAAASIYFLALGLFDLSRMLRVGRPPNPEFARKEIRRVR